jgi:copper chaperone CopZ
MRGIATLPPESYAYMKTITVACNHCSADVIKPLKEYTRSVKRGRELASLHGYKTIRIKVEQASVIDPKCLHSVLYETHV